jgi:predicted lipid-binding transport protein (Tim44 family)
MSGLLLLALLAVGLVVFRMIMARRQGGARPAMAAPGYGNTAIGPEASVSYPPASARSADAVFGGAASTAAAAAPVTGLPPGVPADFDVEGFLKGARQQFVRLQAAFDAADQAVLREFVSDDLLPELSRQIAERGAAPQRTDVVSLEAELLGIHPQGLDHVASVRFHGLIREVESAAAEPFDEVWNLVKPMAGGSGWMLAGIQQLA